MEKELERLRAALQCIATDKRVESLDMARTIARASIEPSVSSEIVAAAVAFYKEWLTNTINIEGGFEGWHGFLEVMEKYTENKKCE